MKKEKEDALFYKQCEAEIEAIKAERCNGFDDMSISEKYAYLENEAKRLYVINRKIMNRQEGKEV